MSPASNFQMTKFIFSKTVKFSRLPKYTFLCCLQKIEKDFLHRAEHDGVSWRDCVRRWTISKKTQFFQIFKIFQQVIKGLSAFYLPLSATVSSCNITGVQVIIVYPLSPLCSFTGGQKCSMKVLLKCPWFKIFCALLGARCHRWWPKDWDKAVFASESRRCCSIVMSFEKATQANLMSASRAVTTGPSQKIDWFSVAVTKKNTK